MKVLSQALQRIPGSIRLSDRAHRPGRVRRRRVAGRYGGVDASPDSDRRLLVIFCVDQFVAYIGSRRPVFTYAPDRLCCPQAVPFESGKPRRFVRAPRAKPPDAQRAGSCTSEATSIPKDLGRHCQPNGAYSLDAPGSHDVATSSAIHH